MKAISRRSRQRPPAAHQPDDPNQPADAVVLEKAALAALTHEYPPERLPRQLIVFLLVGSIGTATDFATTNFFLYVVHLPLVAANSCGITAGLIVSYFTNRYWVFSSSRPATKKHFLAFVLITIVTLYGLQNGLLYVMTRYPEVQDTAVSLTQSIGHLPVNAVRANVAKLVASMIVGLCNFVLYRKFVFLYQPSSNQ